MAEIIAAVLFGMVLQNWLTVLEDDFVKLQVSNQKIVDPRLDD